MKGKENRSWSTPYTVKTNRIEVLLMWSFFMIVGILLGIGLAIALAPHQSTQDYNKAVVYNQSPHQNLTCIKSDTSGDYVCIAIVKK